MKYLIPKSVKTERVLFRNIYFKDVAVILLFFCLSQQLYPFIHQRYQLIFTIYCVIVSFFLTRPMKNMPMTRFWEAIIYWILAPRQSYSRVILDDEKGEN